ncbi:hypothetical protein V7127_23720, partial [Bacillus sp. JJ1773]|uniref:hypothetical protein n=1 Tax=Bacillus sp. JJ1773 TaxID=3122965 RepID=UPI003000687D
SLLRVMRKKWPKRSSNAVFDARHAQKVADTVINRCLWGYECSFPFTLPLKIKRILPMAKGLEHGVIVDIITY